MFGLRRLSLRIHPPSPQNQTRALSGNSQETHHFQPGYRRKNPLTVCGCRCWQAPIDSTRNRVNPVNRFIHPNTILPWNSSKTPRPIVSLPASSTWEHCCKPTIGFQNISILMWIATVFVIPSICFNNCCCMFYLICNSCFISYPGRALRRS